MVSMATIDAETQSEERRAFVVAGMHRSGTSAMTRTLSLLGASLPKRLMEPHACNPTGFWESPSIADLNDEILQALDSEWDDVFSFRSREYLSNFDRFYAGRAVELLGEEFNGSEVIALKDPRISVLATFWDRALRNAGYRPHYIVMVRNPLEVAASLHERNGFPREKSFMIWTSHMIAINRDTRTRPRTFVSYDQLMRDWRSVRRRIETDSGLPFPRDTAAAALEIDRYLDNRFRHHSVSSGDLFARSEVPEHVKAIYAIFSGACEGRGLECAGLEAIEAEFSKMDQIVGPLIADLKLSTRSLSHQVAELRDASSAADNHAKSLAELLESERSEHEHSTHQIETRASSLEIDRDRLSAELQEKQREFDESRMQFQMQLEEQERQTASILERLREREEEVTAVTKALVSSESKVEELAQALAAAQSQSGEFESRLSAQLHETATLSELLQESRQSATAETEKIRRIRQLFDAIVSQPRWWSMLSRSQRSRLQRARLRRLDLFDAQFYLSTNPDVQAAGEDPIHHYIHHGLDEQRPIQLRG